MRVLFRMPGAIWFTATVFVVAAPLHAADFTPVPGREFRETVNARIPVNGESVVGVTMPPGDARAPWQGLWVKAPSDLRSRPLRVSVEIASVDAVYRGTAELKGAVDASDDEWLRLPIEPTGKHIQPFLNGEVLAVKVLAIPSSGEDDRDGGERVHLVASWVDPGSLAADAIVRLHVNSQRGDMFLLGERCKSIRWDRRTRFDAVCDLPVDRIPADGKVTLLRRDGASRSTQDIRLLY